MSEKIKPAAAIKRFFERDDAFAPGGGRRISVDEVKALTGEQRQELAKLCAEQLGLSLDIA